MNFEENIYIFVYPSQRRRKQIKPKFVNILIQIVFNLFFKNE